MMNTRKSWADTLKSEQQQTLMHSFLSTVVSDDVNDRDYINFSLSQIDKRLSRMHAQQYYDPTMITRQTLPVQTHKNKLYLPKQNTLTDAMIRNTLGCDQKYAKSYLELLDQTKEQGQKRARIDQIKKKFSQSNNFVDVCANTKPHFHVSPKHNFRPVVDNEHQAYLKTQLIFLQKPNNPKITDKQYFDKHYDQVTKKIEELGGMEDTLSKMQSSLTQNEIKSFRKRQKLQELSTSPRRNPFSLPKKSRKSQIITQKTWLDRSRIMRETFKNKFNIS